MRTPKQIIGEDALTQLIFEGYKVEKDNEDTDLIVSNGIKDAADEIERLRKMLTDHGINPDAEYIGPGGRRVDSPASKEEPTF